MEYPPGRPKAWNSLKVYWYWYWSVFPTREGLHLNFDYFWYIISLFRLSISLSFDAREIAARRWTGSLRVGVLVLSAQVSCSSLGVENTGPSSLGPFLNILGRPWHGVPVMADICSKIFVKYVTCKELFMILSLCRQNTLLSCTRCCIQGEGVPWISSYILLVWACHVIQFAFGLWSCSTIRCGSSSVVSI